MIIVDILNRCVNGGGQASPEIQNAKCRFMSSRLLEILGRAITIDTADLICHCLNEAKPPKDSTAPQLQRLDKIIELIGNRELDVAAEQLKLYLFENPSCTRGRLAAAAICLRNNQIQAAIEQLNSVYLRQPSSTIALYALGHCYERLDKESQAVEFYQDCLKFKNYLQLPRQRLAAIYFKNGQLEKTIQEYELLRNEYPDDVAVLVTLGHLYIATQKYTRAIEAFNTAVLVHPDNFDTQADDIDQLIAEGQLHEALGYLEDLLEKQPERADLMAKRADILAMLDAVVESIRQYEEAIHICPDFLEATIKLGTQYLQTNHPKLAAQQFNRAAEINDRIVDAYIGLAIAYKLAGNLSDALATLSLATAIEANSSLLLAQTATLQFKESFMPSHNGLDSAGLLEAVISTHHQQIAHRPQNPDLHYRLGILMMSVKRISDAIKSFQTVLEINPTFSRARSKLAMCLFEINKRQDALEQLFEPKLLDKDTLELHYRVALLYCNRAKFTSSLINLNRLLENNFTCADATVNISIVLQNLGLLDRADVMWNNLSETADYAINAKPFSQGQL